MSSQKKKRPLEAAFQSFVDTATEALVKSGGNVADVTVDGVTVKVQWYPNDLSKVGVLTVNGVDYGTIDDLKSIARLGATGLLGKAVKFTARNLLQGMEEKEALHEQHEKFKRRREAVARARENTRNQWGDELARTAWRWCDPKNEERAYEFRRGKIVRAARALYEACKEDGVVPDTVPVARTKVQAKSQDKWPFLTSPEFGHVREFVLDALKDRAEWVRREMERKALQAREAEKKAYADARAKQQAVAHCIPPPPPFMPAPNSMIG